MAGKKRADVLLVEKGLFESREKAQAAIMAGQVFSGEKKILKASEQLTEESDLQVRGPAIPYVGRGGLKLEKAIEVFGADLSGRVCMDIGCATGGFTDVCLQNGAAHVYSVDVGYGQFDWKLRNDPRVTLMERTNARYLTNEMVPLSPNVTVMDVSFISIRLLLPILAGIMGDEGIFYTLIKPQFEAGRGKVGKNGVVRDREVHMEVLREIRDFCHEMHWKMTGLDYSPITGPKGNIEFLACIKKKTEKTDKADETDPGENAGEITDRRIAAIVDEAHSRLKG